MQLELLCILATATALTQPAPCTRKWLVSHDESTAYPAAAHWRWRI